MDRNLAAFLAVAEEGTLSEASQKVALTQSALSKRIANLEDELGLRLFERHRRGMLLTEAGTIFEKYARRISNIQIEAREELKTLVDAGIGTLRIGAGTLYHQQYAAPLIADLARLYPDLKFELIAGNNSSTIPALRDGKLDVVLGALEPLDDDDSIIAYPVFDLEQAVLMSADDPLAAKPVLSATDLIGSQWIVYSGTGTEHIPAFYDYYRKHDLGTPEIFMVSTSFSTALELVALPGKRMLTPSQLAPKYPAMGLTTRCVQPTLGKDRSGVHVRRSASGVKVIPTLIERLRLLARPSGSTKPSA